MEKFLIIGAVALLCLYIKKRHFIELPINVYGFECKPDLFKKENIRLLSPGCSYFVFNKNKIQYLTVPVGTNRMRLDGYLKDMTKYHLQIDYVFDIPKEEIKIKELYNIINLISPFHKDNDMSLKAINKTIELKITDIVDKIMLEKTIADIKTRLDLEWVMNEAISAVRESQFMIDFCFLSASFSIENPLTSEVEHFEKAELTYEDLKEAGYNDQQINQILKASEKNIYLNNINPIVPEEVLRKIRRNYSENNKVLKDYIYELTIKDKSYEEVLTICRNILANYT